MQELIKYFEALEARLNALDARIAAQDVRIAALERSVGSITPVLDELRRNSEALKGHIDNIQEVLDAGVQVTPDPDVEVELVYPEDEEVTVELPQEEVSQPEPTVDPEQPKPEAPKTPQQTTLFGTPVSDIRQAVSIGDRFLFQRELFAGSAEKLQKTLTELNGLHNLDEAVALVEKFGWDKQSPTYELFLNVLRRRFQ